MKKRIITVVAVVLVVAMLSVVLVACGAPANMTEAKEKLEKAGYSAVGASALGVGLLTISNKEDASIGGIAVFVEDMKKIDEQYAKYEKQYKEEKKELQADIDELKKKLDKETDPDTKAKIEKEIKSAEDSLKNYTIEKKGNWIAFGHKKAVKALF